MPELPDVEHFRRTFARHAPGRTIRRVLVTDEGVLRNASAGRIDGTLRDHRFGEPSRRGKWLIAATDGPAMLLHFGMTGDIVWAADDEGRHPHDRVVVIMDVGEIRYRNMRKLGGVWLARDEVEVEELLRFLGPDALELRLKEFLELIGTRRGRIKPALMDQSFVAGIGNLLADEILWKARIHPARRIDDLSHEDRVRLYRALRTTTRHTVDRYPDGFHARWAAARGKPGALCPRCRTPIARTTLDGRTTFLCPRCQV